MANKRRSRKAVAPEPAVDLERDDVLISALGEKN